MTIAILSACAGFLLAVLWMDLIFDTQIVPNAVQLGRRLDPVSKQTGLARAICRDHVLCAVSMALFLVVLLVADH